MRIIMPSLGRHNYSPTMDSLPKNMLRHLLVLVPKKEYRDYKRSPVFAGAKIECWPDYVDCIPKKRRYLYENIEGSYLVADDDISLMVWSKERGNFVPAKSLPDKFEKGIALTFEKFRDGYTYTGVTNTFMASIKVKKQGTLLFPGEVTFCLAGFSKDRPKIDFKTFFFTDIAMPMQILQKGGKVMTAAYCAFSLRSNKKLQETGTTPYRKPGIVKYSAISMAQQFPGKITGLRDTGNNGGGWSLGKTFKRTSVERGNNFLREFAASEGLEALPPLVELDLRVPREELFRIFKKNWNAAKRGIGNQIP